MRVIRSEVYQRPVYAIFILFGLILVGAQSVRAATYYVSSNGSENYSCSQAQSRSTPLARIAVGIQCLRPGDTLIVGAGIYFEMIGNFMYIPSGTANNPITIMANPGDSVVIKPPAWMPRNAPLIDFEGLHYITFKGFTVDGGGIAGNTLVIGYPSTDITVEGNEIRGARYEGLFLWANSNQILKNKIHSNGFANDDPYLIPYGYGIYLTGASNVIDGNDIYNNGRYGIVGYAPVETVNNNVIRNNLIHNNERMAGAAGILMGGSDNLIYNNTIWDEPGVGINIGFSPYPRNIQIHNNVVRQIPFYAIVVDSGYNIQVYDNVFQ
jgi:parallel beta-helix repeat protein